MLIATNIITLAILFAMFALLRRSHKRENDIMDLNDRLLDRLDELERSDP